MAQSLEEALVSILPSLLPANRQDRMLGSKLSKKLLQADPTLSRWSESSIRQTLSALSGQPTSPIARYDQGFGYYLRQENESAIDAEIDGEVAIEESRSGREFQREEKFRALYMKYLSAEMGPLRQDRAYTDQAQHKGSQRLEVSRRGLHRVAR